MSGNFFDFLKCFRLAKRLDNSRYQAYCPAHDDKNASLSIALDHDKILAFCHAGCKIQDVLSAANLKLSDLFLDGKNSPEAIYQYHTETGGLAYEKLKYRTATGDKVFTQRRLDAAGKKIIYDLKGTSHIPYNYPGVIKAIRADEVILLPEGEKDAETARILGYAYTTMGGAADWKDEWKAFFRNARIVQVADNDNAGVILVHKITRSLCEVCKSLKVVILPEGRDLTEWVTLGHGRADLDRLIAEAPQLVKAPRGAAMRPLELMLKEIDAEPQANDLIQDLLPDSSSVYMLICGRSGIGKTFLALDILYCLASGKPFLSHKTRQCKVGYLSMEGAKAKIAARFRTIGASFEGAQSNIFWEHSLAITLNTQGIDRLKKMISGLTVVIVDPLRPLVWGDYTSPKDASNFIKNLQTIQSETGTTLILLHHVRKPDRRYKVQPEDLQFEIKGASEYVEAATTVLLLERVRQSKDIYGKFKPVNPEEKELHFVKIKDAPTDLKPVRLRFNNDTLLFEPVMYDWGEGSY